MLSKTVVINEETITRVDSIQVRQHPFREMVAIEFVKNTSNHPVGAMFEVGLDDAYTIGLALIAVADEIKMRQVGRRKGPMRETPE